MQNLQLNQSQLQLRRRLLEHSFEHKLSHLGSCLTVLDAIDLIFSLKKPEEFFVLSNGHSGVALYVVLEKLGVLPTEKMSGLFIHPDRNLPYGIQVSTGSLGQGYSIAAGLALADRQQRTYCITSDGEWAEGSMWETLSLIADAKLNNLLTIVNANGWSAYRQVDSEKLIKKIHGFGCEVKVLDCTGPTTGYTELKQFFSDFNQTRTNSPIVVVLKTSVDYLPFLQGQAGHYHQMTESEYRQALEILQVPSIK